MVLALKKSKTAFSFRTEKHFNFSEQMQYFTGLPTIEVLRVVHDFCLKIVCVNVNSVLSTFQELVSTLCGLFLNLNAREVAYRFGISVQHYQNYFINGLMYCSIGWANLSNCQREKHFLKLHYCPSELTLETK